MGINGEIKKIHKIIIYLCAFYENKQKKFGERWGVSI